MKKVIKRIECIKGFCIDGGSFPIMQGEVFELSDDDDMVFESVENGSMNPGMEIQFSEDQLCNNFKFASYTVS